MTAAPSAAEGEIRASTTADLDALMTLEVALFGPIAWSRAAMSTELAEAGTSRIVLVAESAGKICGYAILLDTGDDANLLRIAVRAGDQRTGIGSRLLRALLGDCRLRGLARVLLEVADDNSAARALYSRHGFVEIARRPRYYADGRTAIVMRKDLGTHDDL